MHEHPPLPPGDPRNLDYLAELVLGYLATHPQAADTVEGIAEWWVQRQQIRALVHNVTEVVRRLTEAGVLEQVGTGPHTQFRLARRTTATVSATFAE